MGSKHPSYKYLSTQIVWRFCVFTLFLSAIYGFILFVLLYTLEDSFIEKKMAREITFLTSQFELTGQWPTPRSNNMSLHFSRGTFPYDIRQKALNKPQENEFFGLNDRHYHVITLPNYKNTYLVSEVSQELEVRPMREGIIKFLVVSGLIVTIIACLIAWLIGRKMAKPLRKLAELVDGVAPESVPKHFSTQFPKNEIGILANTLEDAFARISLAIDRERCFTRDVSHELRTPLAVIQNAAELYISRNNTSTSDLAIIKRIAQAAQQMEKTVETLLMLAREEHHAEKNTQVSLMTVIEHSVLNHAHMLDGKPVQVLIDDTCQQRVFCQEGMLKVLIDNLLSNAFQYTLAGEVKLYFENCVLTVCDTGPGIDPHIADNVTQAAVKSKQSTGFGFGLAIVSRLCEHSGWQLRVQSNVANESGTKSGTTISVRIEKKE